MPHQDSQQFLQEVGARLTQKGYAAIGTVQPLDAAFFKAGVLGQPYVIAFVDTAHVANTPTEIVQRVEGWVHQLIGHQGAACIMFIYHGAPAVTTVEEIQKIGNYFTCGAHDLHTGRHWLVPTLGWDRDIYG